MILFSPQQLTTGTILQSFEIIKSGKSVSYAEFDLTHLEIKKRFTETSKEMKDLLRTFSKQEIKNIKTQLRSIDASNWERSDTNDYLENFFLRKIHDTFSGLLPFITSVKSYHKIKDSFDKYKTSPCSFNTSKLRLQFEVGKCKNQMNIIVRIELDGKIYNLSDFNRYYFFLEQNDNYWLLGYKDFRTLEWLQTENLYGHNEEDFKKHVLQRLEESYKVNRNNFFKKNVIDTNPQSQLMVSELSGSFLMLTPQWIYDGISIEGPYRETEEMLRGGNAYIIKRNQEEEDKFIEHLKVMHPSFGNQRNDYFFLKFEEARKKQWFLKAYHQLLELNVRLLGMDLLKHFRYSEFKPETDFLIKGENGDEIQIKLRVRFGKEEVPLIKLQRILLGGQHHLLLKDDKIAILDESWIRMYGTIIMHGRIHENDIYIERWLAISQNEPDSKEELLKPLFNRNWLEQWEQWQRSELTIPLSSMIDVSELRPYQQKGYEWMILLANAGGWCLSG